MKDASGSISKLGVAGAVFGLIGLLSYLGLIFTDQVQGPHPSVLFLGGYRVSEAVVDWGVIFGTLMGAALRVLWVYKRRHQVRPAGAFLSAWVLGIATPLLIFSVIGGLPNDEILLGHSVSAMIGLAFFPSAGAMAVVPYGVVNRRIIRLRGVDSSLVREDAVRRASE